MFWLVPATWLPEPATESFAALPEATETARRSEPLDAPIDAPLSAAATFAFSLAGGVSVGVSAPPENARLVPRPNALPPTVGAVTGFDELDAPEKTSVCGPV